MVLLLVSPVASADSGFGIADALSNIVKGGIDKFIIGIADSLYEQSFRPDGTETFNGTTTEIWIYKITTYTPDPWKHPEVLEFVKMTIAVTLLYCFVYSAVGFIYVLLSMVAPAGANIVDSLLDRSSAFRNVRIKEYFGNLLVSIGVIGFTTVAMVTLFTINYFVTSFLIVSCFEVKSLSPSADNAILYLMISLFYNTLNGAMYARGILLHIFVMASFIIGALLISNKTRGLGLSVGWYFIGILFLQSAIVFFTTTGFIAVEVMCSDLGIVAGSVSELGLYFLLLVILVLVTASILIGLVRLRKTAVNTVRLVI